VLVMLPDTKGEDDKRNNQKGSRLRTLMSLKQA
jgi:hypothetical protein